MLATVSKYRGPEETPLPDVVGCDPVGSVVEGVFFDDGFSYASVSETQAGSSVRIRGVASHVK